MVLGLKLNNQTHGMGFVLRDSILDCNDIVFASFIIKHPQSYVLEGVVDSNTLSKNEIKQTCLHKCDELYQEFSTLFNDITYAISQDGSRVSRARKAVLEPA